MYKKTTNTVFLWCCNGHQIMAKLSTTSYVISCHINASHVVRFCTETFCHSVTLIGAMRGGRGEAVNCGPQRCSFVARKIERAHTGYHPIWILEYISQAEWNWNFELSWTTALASCRWVFDFSSLKMKHCGKTCASKETAAPAAESSKGGSWLCNKQPTRTAHWLWQHFSWSKYHSQFKGPYNRNITCNMMY